MYVTNIVIVNNGYNLKVGRYERDLRKGTWEVLEKRKGMRNEH